MEMQSTRYRTIKALVFDHVHRTKGNVDYDALTKEVKKHFPGSKWQKTHWAWYKNQITRGHFKGAFSEEERANLGTRRQGIREKAVAPAPAKPLAEGEAPTRGPEAKDPEVKRIGDELLNHVRFIVTLAAGEDSDLRFKLNRWVFSRLLQDEIRIKRPVKQKLWEDGMRACQACNQEFKTLKAVELHRKDGSKGYSAENCELLCRECHQELG